MAEAFHSGFTALFVETPETKELKGEHLKRLRDNLRLAEQLGAQVATVYGEEPAVQIAEYARVSGVTKIVLGRTNHRQYPFYRGKSLADRLTDLAGSIDIYIIPDTQPLYKKGIKFHHADEPWFRWRDLLKTLFVVIMATLIGFGFYAVDLRDANIITIYILGVLITAVWTRGHLYGAIASLLSVVAFNFFFTVPRFTLQANGPDYPVTFLIMLTASIITSSLAARVKKQARQSAQKAYYTELLLSSSQTLQRGKDEQEILAIAARQLSILLERPVLYALAKGHADLDFKVAPKEQTDRLLPSMSAEERGVANWVVKNNKRAGATTNTLASAQNLYLAVRGIKGVMGVVGIPHTLKCLKRIS